MDKPFQYRDRVLYAEDVALDEIARRTGTPCYVYSAAGIVSRYRAYDEAFGSTPHTVCYAVKANSNLAILALLAKAGAGFDIVSGGELYRVLKAGGDPAKVVFSGVGKTAAEVEYALESGIRHFNCESEAELGLIDALAARLGRQAHIAMRVNPDVDAETHPYISTGLRENKFGIAIEEAAAVYDRARWHKHLILDGVSCHIGSQLLNSAPLVESLDRVLALVERLRQAGIAIRHLDLGGGLGVPYQPEDVAPSIPAYVQAVCAKAAGTGLDLTMEPGRSLVAESGLLLTRALYRKKNGPKEFLIVDAAMNDLVRPALYEAFHEILPVKDDAARGRAMMDVVGPVCESGDFLALGREVANFLPGDLLALLTAGAYGFVMSSNYNSRPRAAEVLVEGSSWRVVRRREAFEDLIRGETV